MVGNMRFDIGNEGRERLSDACRLAFSWYNRATHWSVGEVEAANGVRVREDGVPIPRLILYWAVEKHAVPLAFPLDAEAAADFMWGWLQMCEYGAQPDHDGSNNKGWRIYNEGWGNVGDSRYAFVALEPRWMMYGK